MIYNHGERRDDRFAELDRLIGLGRKAHPNSHPGVAGRKPGIQEVRPRKRRAAFGHREDLEEHAAAMRERNQNRRKGGPGRPKKHPAVSPVSGAVVAQETKRPGTTTTVPANALEAKARPLHDRQGDI